MSIIFATGFEHGDTLVSTHPNVMGDGGVHVDAVDIHSGAYSCNVDRGSWTYVLDTPTNEIYLSIWFRTTNVGDQHRIGFLLEDGDKIEWKDYSSGDGTSTLDYGTGTMSVPFQPISGDWHLLELHVLVDDTSGVVELKIDGNLVASHSGDTQPGTAPNKIARFQTYNYNNHWWDDFVLDDANWIGDVRIEGVVPNSDSSVAWTPSTGADNYAVVDDVPSTDTDYVESDTNGQQDLYGKAAWDGTEKTPKGVVVWSKVQVTAIGPGIKQLLNSGATPYASSEKPVNTNIHYREEIVENDPDTGVAWTESGINSATVGIESVI